MTPLFIKVPFSLNVLTSFFSNNYFYSKDREWRSTEPINFRLWGSWKNTHLDSEDISFQTHSQHQISVTKKSCIYMIKIKQFVLDFWYLILSLFLRHVQWYDANVRKWMQNLIRTHWKAEPKTRNITTVFLTLLDRGCITVANANNVHINIVARAYICAEFMLTPKNCRSVYI